MTVGPLNPQLSTDIALCFSGGGYRAAAYHLGALSMLHELGMESRIKYFSTASGGTIVAMKYVLAMIKGTPFNVFEKEFRKFLLDHNIVKDGLEVIAASSGNDGNKNISLIRTAAGIYNTSLTENLSVKHLIDDGVKPGKYLDLIFNATEFRTGGPFRFRISQNARLKFGSGTYNVKPGFRSSIKLGDIVAASSCYPGAFEPINFPEDFDILDRESAKYPFVGKNAAVKSLPMMDGGIFDNQGLAALMTSYGDSVPFEFVLVSDTTQKPETMLSDTNSSKSAGSLTVGALFKILATVFSLIFLTSLVLIGFSLANFSAVPIFQFVSTEIVAIFSLLVTGGLLLLLGYVRFTLSSLDVLGAEFPIWKFIHNLKVSDVVLLASRRVSSAKALVFSVFMKRIRDLNHETSYSATGGEDNRNLLFGKITSSLIYDLLEEDFRMPLAKDKEIRSTRRMRRISRAAGQVPTALWLNEDQLEILVECGRITTCLALLELVWSKWDKANKEVKKADNKAPNLLPPNQQNSNYYAEYTIYKKKWIELTKQKTPDPLEP